MSERLVVALSIADEKDPTMTERAATGKPKQSTLTEKAYESIKHAILRGEIEEGTFLSESEIIRRHGIGRTPFREACNRLHHEQLLEVVPRRGYLVSEITFRSVREIFEVRVVLETMIVELAAKRATPGEVKELDRLAKRSWSREANRNDPEEMVRANTEFHLCLARMTRNRELVRLITGILERTERLSYLELRGAGGQPKEMRALHRPIVEAVRKGDAHAARDAITADICKGGLDIFGERLESPDAAARGGQ
jgi:DNA-binding GntR family transcriptional regulator